MTKFNLYKIVQLSIHAIFLFVCTVVLLTSDMKQMVFADSHATVLFFLMWAMLLANFIFILADFRLISLIKMDYNGLYKAAYSDSIGAIPNRFSCDTIIEKYIDMELPDDIGCIMMTISNLIDVNNSHGRKAGNQLLKDFSGILTNASGNLCFVGRNGGNKFLAVFEDCSTERINRFLDEVDSRITAYNTDATHIAIRYESGIAFSETDDVREITKLIALSDRRLMDK